MRLAIILTLGVLVSTAGCGQPQPQNLQPVVAVYGCYTMLSSPVSPDAPVDGRCENCSGTGKVGDFRVMVDCPVCGGDGVIDPGEEPVDHEPMAVSLDKLPLASPPATTTNRSQSRVACPDGRCNIRR